MNLKEANKEVQGFDDRKLIRQAENLSDMSVSENIQESANMTDDEFETYMRLIVRELMRRDLHVPSSGTRYNLLHMAEMMRNDKEFEGKYSMGDDFDIFDESGEGGEQQGDGE